MRVEVREHPPGEPVRCYDVWWPDGVVPVREQYVKVNGVDRQVGSVRVVLDSNFEFVRLTVDLRP